MVQMLCSFSPQHLVRCLWLSYLQYTIRTSHSSTADTAVSTAEHTSRALQHWGEAIKPNVVLIVDLHQGSTLRTFRFFQNHFMNRYISLQKYPNCFTFKIEHCINVLRLFGLSVQLLSKSEFHSDILEMLIHWAIMIN